MTLLTALGAKVISLDCHLGAFFDSMSFTTDKAAGLLGFLLLNRGGGSFNSFNGSRHFLFYSFFLI